MLYVLIRRIRSVKSPQETKGIAEGCDTTSSRYVAWKMLTVPFNFEYSGFIMCVSVFMLSKTHVTLIYNIERLV